MNKLVDLPSLVENATIFFLLQRDVKSLAARSLPKLRRLIGDILLLKNSIAIINMVATLFNVKQDLQINLNS